jgi:hypothetical protein
MKTPQFLSLLSLFALTACSTTNPASHEAAKGDTETMLVYYHVKPGKDAEFQAVLARAWQIFQSEKMVFSKPHVLVRDTEDGDKPRFVEIFTWVSHDAPDHAPASVKAIWNEEQALCEKRSGHNGIEGGEVEIVKGR